MKLKTPKTKKTHVLPFELLDSEKIQPYPYCVASEVPPSEQNGLGRPSVGGRLEDLPPRPPFRSLPLLKGGRGGRSSRHPSAICRSWPLFLKATCQKPRSIGMGGFSLSRCGGSLERASTEASSCRTYLGPPRVHEFLSMSMAPNPVNFHRVC